MPASPVTMLLVTLVGISCACSRTNSPLPPAESARTPQVLPLLPLQIELPNDAKVQPTSSGVRIIVHPGQRSPLGIDIMRDDTSGSFLGTDATKQYDASRRL